MNASDRGTWDCLQKVVKSEGPAALLFGILPAAVRSLPAGAIQFACYDALKNLISQRKPARSEHCTGGTF